MRTTFNIPHSTLIILLLLLTSCTATRYIPIESNTTQITHDTLRLHTIIADTLQMRDTLLIDRTADTIRITQTRWRTRTRTLRDTVNTIRIQRDTIIRQQPVPVERPAKLSPWQRLKQQLGGIAIIGLIAITAAIAIRAANRK